MVEHRTSPSDDRAQPVESARSAPWGLPAGATTRARRYAAGLDRIGLFTAVLFFLQSLAPSLLPRDWVVQAIVSGIGLFGGYGVGVAVSWTVRILRVPSPPDRVRAGIWRALGVLSAVTIPVFLWMSATWQSEIRHAVGMEGARRHHYVCVLLLSALIAAALLETARGLRWLWRILDRRIRRLLPPVVSGTIAAVVVAAAVVAVMNDVVAAEVRRVAESTFSASDELTAPDVVRPTSAYRSGAPGSLVPWDTLGKDGRTFVGTGPTAHDITALTGRPAVEPVRVYVGRASAGTPEERAGFSAFVSAGFLDSFREFEPGGQHYTWWSPMAGARARNVGWRIDYFLISAALRPRLKCARILPHVTGSDHCPVVIELK